MADIITIGKAKTYQLAMERLLNASPEMDIQEKYVRLFYYPNELKRAQKSIEDMLKPKPPGDVRIDYLPVILPPLVKKYWIHAAIVAGLFYYLGKNV